MNTKIKVGLVGARGYTGLTLLKLLHSHPHIDIAIATSRAASPLEESAEEKVLMQSLGLTYSPVEIDSLAKMDVVFTATPTGVCAQMAGDLLDKGTRVIDMGADFRLQDADSFAHWYGLEHPAPHLLPKSVFGLPELNAPLLKDKPITGVPGCYVTTSLLPLIPLVREAIIDVNDIVIDAKSGVSGAGRTPNPRNIFGEVSENFKAYETYGHRHLPEIQQVLGQVTKNAAAPQGIVFMPHLLPIFAGIFATIHLRAQGGVKQVKDVLHAAYDQATFVSVIDDDVSTAMVRGTNNCIITVRGLNDDPTRVIVLSVLDNLVKGAAGQAIQCLNEIFDFEETAGLNRVIS